MLRIDELTSTIEITKGDTARIPIIIHDTNGMTYVPDSNDTITFTVKRNISDVSFILNKYITDSVLILTTQDTLMLSGDYFYNITMRLENGSIITNDEPKILSIKERI